MDSPRSLMHDLLTFRASDAKRMEGEHPGSTDTHAIIAAPRIT